MTTTTTLHVIGMTCDHCVAAVRSELGAIEGVGSVGVDLASGIVTVTSSGPLDPHLVDAAVEEAGYELAP